MSDIETGFIGLGQMGGPMAANIAAAGHAMHCFDAAGTQQRMPDGASAAGSTAKVAAAAETIFLSVPDGAASIAVAREIAGAPERRVGVVVDLSTVGPKASREAAAILDAAGILYIDAPVSGGAAGAKAATISLMWAGPKDQFERHFELLKSFAKNPFHVGTEAGQGQTVKLLNNFLAATAMAATSEAVLYGVSQGIDMKTMLDVVHVSSGQNTAVSDKFPKRVLTGTYDAGFFTKLLNKDVQLFLANARDAGTPDSVASAVGAIWQNLCDLDPDGDFTRVYEFLRDGKVGTPE